MPDVTVTGVAPELHRALAARAARNGRSMDAEVRAILDQALATPFAKAVQPAAPWPEGAGIGAALAAIGREVGGVELNIVRNKSLPRIPDFE